MNEIPSLKNTFIWMGILGGTTLWCFGGIFQSMISDPKDTWNAVGATVFFGIGFLVSFFKYMEVVGERKKWREERLKAWVLKDLPELPETNWNAFERNLERQASGPR